MPLYESPIKDRNMEKHGTSTDMCECCGNPMKPGESLYVHMNEAWLAVNPEIVTAENCKELTGYNSQGMFRIGNSCAKKMKGFTFNLPD